MGCVHVAARRVAEARGVIYMFFTACLCHFETYCKRREVFVVDIYFSICIYPVTAGSNVNGP
jgi:hypothetical protein